MNGLAALLQSPVAMKPTIACMFVVSTLYACVDEPTTGDEGSGGGKADSAFDLDDGACEAASRSSPESFFNGFRYWIRGIPKNDYRYAATAGGPLTVRVNGMRTLVDLWLLPEATRDGANTFVARYWECHPDPAAPQYCKKNELNTNVRYIEGAWRVNGDTLEMDGFGTGVKSEVHDSGYCVPAIALTFSQDQLTPGLAGQTEHLIRVLSRWSLSYFEQERMP